MSKTSVKKNFTYQMVYEVLVFVLPFITSPYLARVIGAEGEGIYSYSYSIAYYFVLVSMMGVKNYGNRTIAKARIDRDALNQAFSEIFFVHVILSLICIIVYILYINLVREDERVYAMIQGFYVLSALFDISWFFFGLEEFKTMVIRNCVIRLLTVMSIFLLVKKSEDLWKYCAIMSVGNLISQLILWVSFKKHGRFVRVSWSGMTQHIKPLFILFIPTVAISLYKYMDKIMIGSMSSKVQLGFYENSEKVIGIPQTIIASFGMVMLPKMSSLVAQKEEDQIRRYMSISVEFVMCLSFALTFGLMAVAEVFAPVFWGKSFSPCSTMIMGLCIAMPFLSFANIIRTQYLIPHERDREYLFSIIMGAVVNLISNCLLIPIMGGNGAVIGTIAAEATVCLIQVYVTRKELDYGSYTRLTLPFFGFGITMFIPVYLLGQYMGRRIITLAAQIALGITLYGVMILFFMFRKQNPVFLSMLFKLTRRLPGSFGKVSSRKGEDS